MKDPATTPHEKDIRFTIKEMLAVANIYERAMNSTHSDLIKITWLLDLICGCTSLTRSMDIAELEDSTIDDKVDMDADKRSSRMILNMMVENTLSVNALIKRLGTTPSNPPATLGRPLASASMNNLDRDPVKYAPQPMKTANNVETMVANLMLLSSFIA